MCVRCRLGCDAFTKENQLEKRKLECNMADVLSWLVASGQAQFCVQFADCGPYRSETEGDNELTAMGFGFPPPA
jgi:hypothetical protein